MEKPRIAVVGLGSIAQTIHLPILSKLPDVEIAAVCDLDASKAEFIAKKFGVKQYYTDVDKLLAQEPELQGVDICTSTYTHKDVAVAALEAGRDILVEKPLARNMTEAEEIAALARKKERKVMVGMNSRFRPDAMILKSFIEGNELGTIYYAKAGWLRRLSVANPWLTRKEKSGGGVVLDLGIVMCDLALWMLGYPEVVEVFAANYSHNTKDVEDSSIVFMKMKNGTTVTIESSWSFESGDDFFYCDCFGTEGSGLLNPFRIFKRMHGNLVNVAPVSHDSSQSLYRKSYEHELKHWVSVLRGLHPVISTAEEAIHRLKVVDAIYRSAKAGKSVHLS